MILFDFKFITRVNKSIPVAMEQRRSDHGENKDGFCGDHNVERVCVAVLNCLFLDVLESNARFISRNKR